MAIELYQRQKFGLQKINIAELRKCAVLNFLHAIAFRCVTHIHSSQLVTHKGEYDFQWRSAPIAPGERHITGLGMTDPKVRFSFCTKESLPQNKKLMFARWCY
jgi:hypothetical protein